MIFNERLRALREENHMTQAQVSNIIGIANRNYQRLETDGPVPSYQTLLALADCFHVSMDYLAGRTEKREINR